MIRSLFLIVFFLISSLSTAQKEEAFQNEPIALAEVEQPPLFKRCKTKWEPQKQRDCTSSYINEFVNRRFDMKLASKLIGKGVGKLEANFIINQEGKIESVTVTGGVNELNQHLHQIVISLKPFKPGMQNGSPVDVSVHLPVSFRVF